MSRTYQICTRCIMDTSAKDITFDNEGVCNFCTDFLNRSKDILNMESGKKSEKLNAFIEKVKAQGKGKRYDCIIGVSGGVDSSWVLVQAVKHGLRPLAVHMDNGWNSELAQNNIASLVKELGVDLYTHVIDWHEYKNLMQAFFDADVIDIELLYDNAMLAVNYNMAVKHNIHYILSGSNQATEGMRIPREWTWFKYDKKNIKNIGKIFGNVRIKTFPAIGTLGFIFNTFFRRIKWTAILDLMDYNKFEAMEHLKNSYGYKPYPYKHYESIFTRFYQGYILPEKFSVDKRRLHLGTLVISGQMTRDQALVGMEGIPYATEQDLNEDRQYFIKKMGWSNQQLVDYIARPEEPHTKYGSEISLWKGFVNIYNFFQKPSK